MSENQFRNVQLGELPAAMQEYLRELNTTAVIVEVFVGEQRITRIETGRYLASLPTYRELFDHKYALAPEDEEEDEEERSKP